MRIKTVFTNYFGGPLDVFEYGTINGLREPESLIFVAINNDEPHNGHLQAFFDAIERRADQTGERCAIVEFFNQRFQDWVLRRPGWIFNNAIMTKQGLMAGVEYHGKERANSKKNSPVSAYKDKIRQKP